MKPSSLPDDRFAEEVRRHRRSSGHGVIRRFALLDSTNEEMFRWIARERPPEGSAVVADAQSSGRGRRGRTWFSPPGSGLYLSAVYYPGVGSKSPPSTLTLVAGVAASKAIERLTGQSPRLKWPNDLLMKDRKVGGILTESRPGAGQEGGVVIGVGINLHQQEGDFPPDIRSTAASVASVTGRHLDRAETSAALLDALDTEFRSWTSRGFGPTAESWRQRASTLGKRIRFRRDGAAVEGRALDLGDDGSLVVRTARGTILLHSGETTELEPAP